MESLRALVLLLQFVLPVRGWGVDGHLATCKIAQGTLNQSATDAANQLLSSLSENDLKKAIEWMD